MIMCASSPKTFFPSPLYRRRRRRRPDAAAVAVRAVTGEYRCPRRRPGVSRRAPAGVETFFFFVKTQQQNIVEITILVVSIFIWINKTHSTSYNYFGQKIPAPIQ